MLPPGEQKREAIPFFTKILWSVLPLRQIVILAAPAEILVGEAVDELEVILAECHSSAE